MQRLSTVLILTGIFSITSCASANNITDDECARRLRAHVDSVNANIPLPTADRFAFADGRNIRLNFSSIFANHSDLLFSSSMAVFQLFPEPSVSSRQQLEVDFVSFPSAITATRFQVADVTRSSVARPPLVNITIPVPIILRRIPSNSTCSFVYEDLPIDPSKAGQVLLAIAAASNASEGLFTSAYSTAINRSYSVRNSANLVNFALNVNSNGLIVNNTHGLSNLFRPAVMISARVWASGLTRNESTSSTRSQLSPRVGCLSFFVGRDSSGGDLRNEDLFFGRAASSASLQSASPVVSSLCMVIKPMIGMVVTAEDVDGFSAEPSLIMTARKKRLVRFRLSSAPTEAKIRVSIGCKGHFESSFRNLSTSPATFTQDTLEWPRTSSVAEVPIMWTAYPRDVLASQVAALQGSTDPLERLVENVYGQNYRLQFSDSHLERTATLEGLIVGGYCQVAAIILSAGPTEVNNYGATNADIAPLLPSNSGGLAGMRLRGAVNDGLNSQFGVVPSMFNETTIVSSFFSKPLLIEEAVFVSFSAPSLTSLFEGVGNRHTFILSIPRQPSAAVRVALLSDAPPGVLVLEPPWCTFLPLATENRTRRITVAALQGPSTYLDARNSPLSTQSATGSRKIQFKIWARAFTNASEYVSFAPEVIYAVDGVSNSLSIDDYFGTVRSVMSPLEKSLLVFYTFTINSRFNISVGFPSTPTLVIGSTDSAVFSSLAHSTVNVFCGGNASSIPFVYTIDLFFNNNNLDAEGRGDAAEYANLLSSFLSAELLTVALALQTDPLALSVGLLPSSQPFAVFGNPGVQAFTNAHASQIRQSLSRGLTILDPPSLEQLRLQQFEGNLLKASRIFRVVIGHGSLSCFTTNPVISERATLGLHISGHPAFTSNSLMSAGIRQTNHIRTVLAPTYVVGAEVPRQVFRYFLVESFQIVLSSLTAITISVDPPVGTVGSERLFIDVSLGSALRQGQVLRLSLITSCGNAITVVGDEIVFGDDAASTGSLLRSSRLRASRAVFAQPCTLSLVQSPSSTATTFGRISSTASIIIFPQARVLHSEEARLFPSLLADNPGNADVVRDLRMYVQSKLRRGLTVTRRHLREVGLVLDFSIAFNALGPGALVAGTNQFRMHPLSTGMNPTAAAAITTDGGASTSPFITALFSPGSPGVILRQSPQSRDTFSLVLPKLSDFEAEKTTDSADSQAETVTIIFTRYLFLRNDTEPAEGFNNYTFFITPDDSSQLLDTQFYVAGAAAILAICAVVLPLVSFASYLTALIREALPHVHRFRSVETGPDKEEDAARRFAPYYVRYGAAAPVGSVLAAERAQVLATAGMGRHSHKADDETAQKSLYHNIETKFSGVAVIISLALHFSRVYALMDMSLGRCPSPSLHVSNPDATQAASQALNANNWRFRKQMTDGVPAFTSPLLKDSGYVSRGAADSDQIQMQAMFYLFVAAALNIVCIFLFEIILIAVGIWTLTMNRFALPWSAANVFTLVRMPSVAFFAPLFFYGFLLEFLLKVVVYSDAADYRIVASITGVLCIAALGVSTLYILVLKPRQFNEEVAQQNASNDTFGIYTIRYQKDIHRQRFIQFLLEGATGGGVQQPVFSACIVASIRQKWAVFSSSPVSFILTRIRSILTRKENIPVPASPSTDTSFVENIRFLYIFCQTLIWNATGSWDVTVEGDAPASGEGGGLSHTSRAQPPNAMAVVARYLGYNFIRDSMRKSTRLFLIGEIVLTTVVAGVASYEPENYFGAASSSGLIGADTASIVTVNFNGCVTKAGLLLVCNVCFLISIVWWHPYRRYADTAFALLLAAGEVLSAIFIIAGVVSQRQALISVHNSDTDLLTVDLQMNTLTSSANSNGHYPDSARGTTLLDASAGTNVALFSLFIFRFGVEILACLLHFLGAIYQWFHRKCIRVELPVDGEGDEPLLEIPTQSSENGDQDLTPDQLRDNREPENVRPPNEDECFWQDGDSPPALLPMDASFMKLPQNRRQSKQHAQKARSGKKGTSKKNTPVL